FVNDKLRPWKSDGVLRCGVTALGAGGTNCHLVLQEAPPTLAGDGERSKQLLLISAKTRTALDLACDNLASEIERRPGMSLSDAADTRAVGRRPMQHRRAVAAATPQEAIELLRNLHSRHVANGIADERHPKVVFMFPGGGAQYAGMGRELYEQEDVYREAIDSCLDIINPALGQDLDRKSVV